ncbi:hypothetical protein, partial [Parathermosynechococcus lividus]
LASLDVTDNILPDSKEDVLRTLIYGSPFIPRFTCGRIGDFLRHLLKFMLAAIVSLFVKVL